MMTSSPAALALCPQPVMEKLPARMVAIKITEIFLAFIVLFLLFFLSLYHISQDSLHQQIGSQDK